MSAADLLGFLVYVEKRSESQRQSQHGKERCERAGDGRRIKKCTLKEHEKFVLHEEVALSTRPPTEKKEFEQA